MDPLFLTGASGFVGRRVIRLLAVAGFTDVRCLTRDPDRFTREFPLPTGWRLVQGDLSQPAGWRTRLPGVETVLHLAAITGKARRRLHFAVNFEGTSRLVEEAARSGAARFLQVSSIAAGYQDRRHYHYAEAKAAAESAVRASGMDWLIVRPTMVLGPGSPVLKSLRRLASLPVPLLFGSGENEVQPVHVDDLARVLVAALGVHPWGGRILEVGGPETMTMADLLRRLRGTSDGDSVRFRRIPLFPLRALLGALEPVLFSLLPFTAGQLAAFANPSVARPDPYLAQIHTPGLDLKAMLAGPTAHDA